MAKKDKVKDYYAAGIHWIAGGLAIPLVISLVAGFLAGVLLLQLEHEFVSVIVTIVVPILATWLGVFYSARFVLRRYSFEHASKVVHMSTIYFATVSVLIFLGELFAVHMGEEDSIDWLAQIINLLDIFVFYWASKKYVTK